jgi:protein-tyrosine-phosphatase
VEEADLVLAMGPSHLRRAVELGGKSKAWLLRAFAEGREGEELGSGRMAVPDPFGGDDEVYEETYRTLEELIERALRRVTEEGGAGVGGKERQEREGDS